MDKIKVVCGLISYENKVFICRRAKHKSLSGYWEFPGGKIEKGELPESTLVRELKEELNMEVEVKRQFITSHYAYEFFDIELLSFLCDFIDSDFSMTDHDRYEWVLPKDLSNWKLAPADIPIAEQYIELVQKNPY